MEGYIKIILFVLVILFLLYKLGTKNHNFWKNKGVKQLKPIPFLGDDYLTIFNIADILKSIITFHEPFKGCRFGGVYIGQTPFLSITDPELVKEILVKHSEHFINRNEFIGSSDTLFSKNLFSLKGELNFFIQVLQSRRKNSVADSSINASLLLSITTFCQTQIGPVVTTSHYCYERWKRMRTVMTTVFTSAKMKDMFTFMNTSAEQAVKYLEEKFKEHKSKNPEAQFLGMDQKDFYSRYGTDAIATTAYGLEVDSFKNPDNEFYASGLAIRNAMSGLNSIKVMIIFMLPQLGKLLGLTMLGKKYNKYFTSMISDTIKTREERNIVRNDVIHTLMEARKGKGLDEYGELLKGKLPDLTDEDIAAQSFVFFIGGFDTMATLLAFATYELAVHPEIQEELQREIDEIIEKENKITFYGVMHNMPYLNMVLNETLRKWPPALMTDRRVTKTYVIPKTDTSPEVVLNKGDKILISIAGFHYNSDFFPQPEKFDPERFRDEKNNIKPFTFLPFGEGIRHCIAKRYALMEAKIILVHILRKFTFVPTEKTQIPLKLSKKFAFSLVPEKGFWIGVKPRNKI